MKPFSRLFRILPRVRSCLVLLLLLSACRPATGPGGHVRPGTPASVDIVRARERGLAPSFTWEEWGPEAFARAKREGRYLLIDGAAEWCHWCHVMDETTYRDPEVGRLLRERFVAIRVDVDARPDLFERWVDYGWPATILLNPDAEEVGKYRGYLAPERFLALLRSVEALSRERQAAARSLSVEVAATPAMLPWVASSVLQRMDDMYDAREGNWGAYRKAPVGENLEFEVRRAARGDRSARERVVFTLERQRPIHDPVWGGVYQYSAANHWNEQHYEKLMVQQAANLEAYARAWALTKEASVLAQARGIARYMETFLGAPDGTFYTNQDADVGAHDSSIPFVDGHVYYAKEDAGRRALGIPWVDTHVYSRENGRAIAALLTLHEATGEGEPLTRARTAADVLLSSHVREGGTVWREASHRSGPRYLGDAAALGRALALLALRTGEARYREAAVRVGERLMKDFAAPDSGALFETTLDPDAVGVFARRERPFVHNVAAARFLASLHALTGDAAWRERGRGVLAGISTARFIADQGRMIGEFLLAADELGVIAWPEVEQTGNLSPGTPGRG
ncbi:DUF255 domain-containing protein [Hyalangium rubrum]|uniref:DUF255 domain-containing protein n=1 Tax=Hyalangium rubrum TaxID=3103134 RepID=A0ABU5H6N5_9BACT|nr:DUF255 domain-containing protein [Hyalangium sp. s54d21]MDY7227755.1 DUF255 domain-containing protein [Hyalangium sp. s54d21]